MTVTRRCDPERKRVAQPILLLGVLIVLQWVVASQSFAADLDQWIELNVPAGDSLENALLGLQLKGVNLSSHASELAGHRTEAIHGWHRLEDVLTFLLQGTGLRAYVENGCIYIKPAPPQLKPRRRPWASARRSQGKTLPVQDPISSVTVTGSHIRKESGPDSDPGPDILSFGQAEFKESNFQDLGEMLRTLPQNFPGGQNPGVLSAGGSQNIVSLSGASSPDLRGMGAASTLFQINGQRVATSESSGSVDVSGIPILAIKHVDIETGNVSAVYGADAVASTVNVILYDKFEGLEVRVTGGYAMKGGGTLQHYSAIGGHSWGGFNAYAAVDCTQQDAIEASQRDYVPKAITGTTLWPATRGCTGLLSVRGEFQNGVVASVLGMYTARSSDTTDNLNAISAGTSAATDSSVRQYVTLGTVRAPLGAGWSGVVTSSVSTDNVYSPEQLMAVGAPPVNLSNLLDNRLRSIEVSADGPLLRLPNGPLKLAAGSGYSEETFLFDSSPPQPVWISQRRRIRYAFAEGFVPILRWRDSEEDVGASLLSLRLAGRTAWYSDLGETVNPEITLRYESARHFSIGGSWGTSYRPPTLVQQYGPSQSTLEFVDDPNVSSHSSLALLQFGGNPHVRPERSSSVTLDFAFAPLSSPDTLIKMTLFKIDDRKRIEYPTTNILQPLLDANAGPYTTRSPSETLIAQTIAQSPLENNRAGPEYSPSQATVLINDLDQNASHQRARGADLIATWSHDSPIGTLKPSVNIAYLDLRQQLTSATPDERLSGTVFYPPLLRSRFGLNWNAGNYWAALFFNYTGSSRNVETDPPQHIGSWETFDATVGYTVHESKYWGNTQFVFSARNLLNHRPPFVTPNPQRAPAPNFDTTNSSANGAILMFGVNFKF